MHLLSKASSERTGSIAKALQTAARQSAEQSFKRKWMMDLKREEPAARGRQLGIAEPAADIGNVISQVICQLCLLHIRAIHKFPQCFSKCHGQYSLFLIVSFYDAKVKRYFAPMMPRIAPHVIHNLLTLASFYRRIAEKSNHGKKQTSRFFDFF